MLSVREWSGHVVAPKVPMREEPIMEKTNIPKIGLFRTEDGSFRDISIGKGENRETIRPAYGMLPNFAAQGRFYFEVSTSPIRLIADGKNCIFMCRVRWFGNLT